MKKEIENKLIDCIGIENVKLEEPMENILRFESEDRQIIFYVRRQRKN